MTIRADELKEIEQWMNNIADYLDIYSDKQVKKELAIYSFGRLEAMIKSSDKVEQKGE